MGGHVCPANWLSADYTPNGGCFSGNTLVRTLEHPAPIPLEELKTGDHVQCMDSSDDMRLPTTPKYCEVKNCELRLIATDSKHPDCPSQLHGMTGIWLAHLVYIISMPIIKQSFRR